MLFGLSLLSLLLFKSLVSFGDKAANGTILIEEATLIAWMHFLVIVIVIVIAVVIFVVAIIIIIIILVIILVFEIVFSGLLNICFPGYITKEFWSNWFSTKIGRIATTTFEDWDLDLRLV